MHDVLMTNNRMWTATRALGFFLLLVLLIMAMWLELDMPVTAYIGIASKEQYPAIEQGGIQLDLQQGASTSTILTSTLSGCMEIVGDYYRQTMESAASEVMLIWEGTPTAARLIFNSCGVKPGRHHTIYLNGQPVAQVVDDGYNACTCYGSGGPDEVYPLSDPSVVVSGWNVISITNDADFSDCLLYTSPSPRD